MGENDKTGLFFLLAIAGLWNILIRYYGEGKMIVLLILSECLNFVINGTKYSKM